MVREGSKIELTPRQMEIVNLVRERAPITGEQIAEWLGATRPAIRSDLVLLGMLGYLEAKPKVGYFPGRAANTRADPTPELLDQPVRNVMGVPIVLRETSTVSDAVVTMFLENVGSIAVTDEAGVLAGIVSRKDLLKVTLGNVQAASVLLGMVMTRYPNVTTIAPDDTVADAVRKMIRHQVDGLPVVQRMRADPDNPRYEPIGRITKTSIVKLLYESIAADD